MTPVADREISRSTGFTLVELLIAITLFALLSVMLFGSLRFGIRATDQGTLRMERLAEIAAATNFLRTQLSDAQPLTKNDADGTQSVAFDGERDRLEFVGLPPAYLAPGGWHTLEFVTERSGRFQHLAVRLRTLSASDPSSALSASRGSVLLDHVRSVAFSYFGKAGNEDTAQWHDEWQGAAYLPALVRLRIAFDDGGQAPDIVIAVRPAPAPY